jgi:hypothetical protein
MDRNQPPASKSLRCPYCAEGADFRLMAQRGASDACICQACGHLAMPGFPTYQCFCRNCRKLEQRRRDWTEVSPPVAVGKRGPMRESAVKVQHPKPPRRVGAG